MLIYPDLIAIISEPFDPEEDAYKLKSIMKGRYENLIIFYLSTIPNDWRQEVSDVFFYDFGRNLTKDLQSLLSKDVHDLISAIMTPPAVYQCTMLNYYLKGPGTDKRLLLEILCTISKPEIAEIAETYEILYDRTLTEHMFSETSDDFRRLLTHIVNGARYDDTILDTDRAWEAVLLLDQEGPAMWGMEHGTFVQILENESFAMIRLIFILYKNIDGRTIEEVIRNEIYGELKNAMVAIGINALEMGITYLLLPDVSTRLHWPWSQAESIKVNCIMNPSAWLARKLHDVMEGTDPDDNAMVRIIVGRAERDLVAINRSYDMLYDKSLRRAIVDFSEWKDTCRCLGNTSFRRFFSSFYKPRNVTVRNIAKKILFFTILLEDVF